MKSFVFWTGMISLLAGIGFQFPAFAEQMMPSEQPGMLLHLFGLMALFLGVMLIFCSRDLKHRGTLVLWEGLLRVGGFVVMASDGLWGGGGLQALGAGVFDLVIGVVYLVGLPRHLGIPVLDLLLDRSVSSVGSRRG